MLRLRSLVLALIFVVSAFGQQPTSLTLPPTHIAGKEAVDLQRLQDGANAAAKQFAELNAKMLAEMPAIEQKLASGNAEAITDEFILVNGWHHEASQAVNEARRLSVEATWPYLRLFAQGKLTPQEVEEFKKWNSATYANRFTLPEEYFNLLRKASIYGGGDHDTVMTRLTDVLAQHADQLKWESYFTLPNRPSIFANAGTPGK